MVAHRYEVVAHQYEEAGPQVVIALEVTIKEVTVHHLCLQLIKQLLLSTCEGVNIRPSAELQNVFTVIR